MAYEYYPVPPGLENGQNTQSGGGEGGGGYLARFKGWLNGISGGSEGIGSSFLQQTNPDGSTTGGYGTAALGIAQGALGAYVGLNQVSLAKDTLKQNKRQFNLNFNAQAGAYNRQLEDQTYARQQASNGTRYESPTEYLSQNRQKLVGE